MQRARIKDTARLGTRLLLISAALAKLVALAGQVALGWFLEESDWGVYALVLGVASITQVIRDGGVGYLILHRGGENYTLISGPAFWISASFNAVAAIALLLVAPAAAWLYDNPLIWPMLSVVALSIVAGTATPVLRANLQGSFRFGALAACALFARVVTWTSAVAMAAIGAGAMSFVWSTFAGALSEAAIAWLCAKDNPWRRSPNLRCWPSMLQEGLWVLFGSFAAALAARIDYLTFGFFMGVQTLGIYVFAYEMTAQLPILVWGSLMAVLFPVLAKLSMDQRLFAEAAQAFIMPAFLAVGIPSLFFAAACEPIELLLWGGKWSAAVPLMQIFACAAPIRVMLLVPEAMLLAMGSFKQRALIILARAAAVGVAATCAGTLAPADVFTAALLVAITQAVIALATAVLILRSYRCQISRLARPMLTSMLALAVTAVAAAALDAIYLDQNLTPFARTVVLFAVYALLSMLTLRIFVPQETKKLLQILPRHARRLATLVLILRN